MALSPLLGLYGSLDERALKLGVLFRYWAKVRYISAVTWLPQEVLLSRLE